MTDDQLSTMTQKQVEALISELVGKPVGRHSSKADAIKRWKNEAAKTSPPPTAPPPSPPSPPPPPPPVAPPTKSLAKRATEKRRSVLSRRKFELLFDPEHSRRVTCHVVPHPTKEGKWLPTSSDAKDCRPMTQGEATKQFEEMGRQILARWHAHGEKVMTGDQMATFLEKDREKHFPKCKRPSIMRAFQDYMTVFPGWGLARRLPLDD